MMKSSFHVLLTLCVVAFWPTLTASGQESSNADKSKTDPAKKEANDTSKSGAAKADTKKDSDKKDTDKSDANKNDDARNDSGKGDSKAGHHGQHTFLGVYVSSAHPALSRNFGDILSPEQGLIVEDLADDSPAAKAGIKPHDILTTFDDQKLFSAEQLAKLVHADKAGREVTVGCLRDGKIQKIQVTLGSVHSPRARPGMHPHDGMHHGMAGHRHMQAGDGKAGDGKAADSNWENFDSLTLKKVGDKKFHAEVQYLDKNGKNEKHAFDGTRDEIKKAIESEKDLKPAERDHLLRSLQLTSSDDEMMHFPFVLFPDFYFDDSDNAS